MAENQKPIRFGILGCAAIAIKLSRAIALAHNATVSAVGSRSVEKAKKFAAENGLLSSSESESEVKIYGSYEGVLEDPEVDAVYVPLPTSLHVKWAVIAAEKGKHILLEKPVALNVAELDLIINACEANRVQFMDATMWMHHPRTAQIKHLLSNMGKIELVNSFFTYRASTDFLKNNIRVKSDMDALGALGDIGWYCIRAILWAYDYHLPNRIKASDDSVFNDAGVILSCGASLYWQDGKKATFYCSFLSNTTMDITVLSSHGTLHVHDFVIPFCESEASYSVTVKGGFHEIISGIAPERTDHTVATELPQEALMVEEFCRCVMRKIKGDEDDGSEKFWPIISRKTQLVLDAVKFSIQNGSEPVEVEI